MIKNTADEYLELKDDEGAERLIGFPALRSCSHPALALYLLDRTASMSRQVSGGTAWALLLYQGTFDQPFYTLVRRGAQDVGGDA